jgi:hypothetical protein
VSLGHRKYCRYALFRFRFYSSLFMCLACMCNIQDTAIIAVDKSDAGVGTECRRQFLNRYGFRVSTTL